MAEIIIMPKLGFDMKEGQLVDWMKGVGETIALGDILAEIESDKATVEVESFSEGTLLEQLVGPGDWVPVGSAIAIVGEAGEAYDKAALGLEETAPAEAETVGPAAAAVPEATPVIEEVAETVSGLPDGVRASPLARKVADDRGVEISRISGTGPFGRILRADVESHEERTTVSISRTPVSVEAEDIIIPVSRIRSRIAARMVESKTTVPHFSVTAAIRMDAALALRKEINARFEKEESVSVNDLVVKAAALALRQFPNLNASYNGESIVHYGHVNIGIAVALDDGLINVVSADADVTPLTEMGARHRAMIARARGGKIRPEDVEGETFAVSNLGPFDVEQFQAIINPPAAAILAVGSAMKEAVVEDDTLVIGTILRATLSADHRVTDGAEAALFMKTLKDLLEDPLRLLV